MSRLLDAKRREQWAAMGESHPQLGRGPNEDGSGRPEHPPQRYLTHHSARRRGGDGDPVRETISLEPQQCLGKASAPPPGVEAERWSEMDTAEQRLVLDAHYEAEAECQLAYEASAAPHSRGRGE